MAVEYFVVIASIDLFVADVVRNAEYAIHLPAAVAADQPTMLPVRLDDVGEVDEVEIPIRPSAVAKANDVFEPSPAVDLVLDPASEGAMPAFGSADVAGSGAACDLHRGEFVLLGQFEKGITDGDFWLAAEPHQRLYRHTGRGFIAARHVLVELPPTELVGAGESVQVRGDGLVQDEWDRSGQGPEGL